MKKFFLSSLFLLFASHAYAVCNYAYTVCPSGCDSNVLNTVVTTVETECASPSSPITITISGSWSSADTNAVGISGITLSATNTLTIATSGDARHNGTLGNGYRIVTTATTTSGIVMGSGANYVRIDGLSIDISSNTANSQNGAIDNYNGASSDIRVSNCIIKPGKNIAIRVSRCYSTIWNCILIKGNAASGGIEAAESAQQAFTTKIYNVTSPELGYLGQIASLFKNNFFASYSSNNGYSGSSTNNASVNTTAPAVNTYYTNVSPTFVNSAAGDYHLSPSDTALKDLGANTCGDASPLNYTTDIDGQTRTGTWDIGADEYVASASGGGGAIIRNSIIRNSIIR